VFGGSAQTSVSPLFGGKVRDTPRLLRTLQPPVATGKGRARGGAANSGHAGIGRTIVECLHSRSRSWRALSTDLSPILELLNQARKDAGYEGEAPDFGDLTSEDLLSTVEDAVQTAEKATHTAENETNTAEDAAQNTQVLADTEEESIP
jgi:hypothetical protein